MPVIGRLDKQVDKVLIAPLARNDATHNQTPPTNAQPENAADTAHSDARALDEASQIEKTRIEKESLPVWLL